METPEEDLETQSISELELPVGLEKLESTIEWSSFDQGVLQALAEYGVHLFQIRGNLEVFTSQGLSAQLPVVFLMSGMVKDSGKAAGEAQTRVKTTTTVTIWHSELAVAGVNIFTFDAFANIYTVGGVDQLAQFRGNLGG